MEKLTFAALDSPIALVLKIIPLLKVTENGELRFEFRIWRVILALD